jgi:periplasmic protein CpxP/Spy
MTGTTNRALTALAASAFSLLTLLTIAAPALATGPLLAQATPAPSMTSPAPPAGGQPGHPHRMSHRHGMLPADPMKDVEARISALHKKLSITDEQEPQFKAYADVLRSNAQTMQDLFQQRMQASGENAVDRLHWYAKLTAAHADAVNKLVPPFEALYQGLSDKQKKAADAEFRHIRQRRPAHRAG